MNRPLIAILRGVRPDEAIAVSEALLDEGVTDIEVSLNSSEPLVSIAALVETFGDRARIGAGTVLSSADVAAVAATGARLIVSPDANPDVIGATVAAGLVSIPGVATPSEAFRALAAGADALKVFPAGQIGLDGVRAWGAVLPPGTALYAVGGVGSDDFGAWLAAGVTGFGIGSALYRAGSRVDEVRARTNDRCGVRCGRRSWPTSGLNVHGNPVAGSRPRRIETGVIQSRASSRHRRRPRGSQPPRIGDRSMLRRTPTALMSRRSTRTFGTRTRRPRRGPRSPECDDRRRLRARPARPPLRLPRLPWRELRRPGPTCRSP